MYQGFSQLNPADSRKSDKVEVAAKEGFYNASKGRGNYVSIYSF